MQCPQDNSLTSQSQPQKSIHTQPRMHRHDHQCPAVRYYTRHHHPRAAARTHARIHTRRTRLARYERNDGGSGTSVHGTVTPLNRAYHCGSSQCAICAHNTTGGASSPPSSPSVSACRPSSSSACTAPRASIPCGHVRATGLASSVRGPARGALLISVWGGGRTRPTAPPQQ
jgi:hypothetical protein